MADNQSTTTEWYLARDGQQFGPITIAEMRKLIEFGHLKDTDLVWRVGLAEWQPSSFAISELDELARRTAQQEAPAPSTSQQPGRSSRPEHQGQQPDPSTIGQHGQNYRAGQNQRSSPQHPASAHDAASAQAPGAYRPGPQAGQGPRGGYGSPAYGPGLQQQAPGSDQSPQANRMQQRGPHAYQQPAAGYGPQQQRAQAGGGQIRPAQLGGVQRPADVADDDDYDDDAPRGSVLGVIVRSIAAILILSLIGAGGWYAYLNKDTLLAMAGLQPGNVSAPLVSASDDVQTLAPSTGAPPETGAAARPIELFQTELWETVDEAFPLWAAQRKEEALEAQRNGKSEGEVERGLLVAIATLRRKYWQNALSAEPNSLRTIATVFVENLKALTDKDVEACYSFIRQGEASPKVLALLNDESFAGPLRQQLQVIMQAIMSGRRDPNTHAPPLQKDYRLISQELTKLGWTNNEMTMFGDPKKLAQAEPAQVCKLVTDWFTAQLLLTDSEAQTRLLVQSLRPVVSG